MRTIMVHGESEVEVDVNEALDLIIDEMGAEWVRDEALSHISEAVDTQGFRETEDFELSTCCKLAVEVLREASFGILLRR